MHKIILLFTFVYLLSFPANEDINIIPVPAKMLLPQMPGTFIINKNTRIVLVVNGLEKSAGFLDDYVLHLFGFRLRTARDESGENSIVPSILLC